MSGFLLDTIVISELVKARPDPGVTQWIEATDEILLYLSVLTLGEIRKGISSLPDAKRRTALEAWLDRDLALRFSNRILSTAGTHTSGTIAYSGKAAGTSAHPAIHFNDATTGLGTTCDSATAAGIMKLGAHVSGTGAGSITKTTWTNCQAPVASGCSRSSRPPASGRSTASPARSTA